MASEQRRGRLSRRGLIQGATAGAVAAVPLMGIANGSRAAAFETAKPVMVTATVVRASHAATPGTLRIGVRTSIMTPGESLRTRVLVVEAVPFGRSPDETGRLIADGVRVQVARLISSPERRVDPEDVAVQVFGGAL